MEVSEGPGEDKSNKPTFTGELWWLTSCAFFSKASNCYMVSVTDASPFGSVESLNLAPTRECKVSSSVCFISFSFCSASSFSLSFFTLLFCLECFFFPFFFYLGVASVDAPESESDSLSDELEEDES